MTGTQRRTSWWCTARVYFLLNQYELVSWMSELTRSPSGTSRATSWWSSARVYFLLNTHVSYMFYAQFFMTNPYKLVLRMSESTKSSSGLCGSRILLYTTRMLLSKSLRVTQSTRTSMKPVHIGWVRKTGHRIYIICKVEQIFLLLGVLHGDVVLAVHGGVQVGIFQPVQVAP